MDTSYLYILMILAGIALLIWFLAKNGKKEEKNKPPRGTIVNPLPAPPPNPGTIKTPNKMLAKDVQCIYYHVSSTDRAAHKIWVCRECEVENSVNDESCVLCGASRTGG